ncbi:helix-turn-helix transcriptional regulator [Bordetella holmesii]|nr:AraC family transcriptional regulator [Bordetella holmesii]AIT28161.1 bacterial regulatory helix-turn-helix s, AraC family protein [Bordetella holmesii 44057]AMD46867.1 enterobactin-dependent positive regulator [Bordetella holmesii H558]AMD47751.1 AraC family transcriptional regulator [Bordetella holmesii F627]EWM44219.1 bacterial regulatory helix-turn-helix s, AraC family protein [Bordetella holmesii 41130]EWM44839.1 bacterial regulatory helix-turn-helix s, AraC family protein [Bordetella 
MDWRDLQGGVLRSQEGPGFYLLMVAGGGADLYAGDTVLAQRTSMMGHAVTWSADVSYELVRYSRRGDVERAVQVHLTPEWLASRLAPENPLRKALPLQPYRWPLSRGGLARLQQLLHPPRKHPDLLPLYMEARVLELLRETGGLLCNASDEGSTLSRRKLLRMVQVKELLESGCADEWSLAQIAARHHLSVNTLQRHFRAAWKCAVDEFRRDARLRRARAALEREGVRVARAAEIAGYRSPANFATAFRRAYGMAPRQALGTRTV